VVDVRRNDGAAGGDFGADEFGCDLRSNALGKAAKNGRDEFGGRSADRGMLSAARVLLFQVVADEVVLKVGEASSRRTGW
jgi:hypothetical protein